jgi:hypothetical protein
VAEPRAVATGKCSSSGVRLSFGKVARESKAGPKKFICSKCLQSRAQ